MFAERIDRLHERVIPFELDVLLGSTPIVAMAAQIRQIRRLLGFAATREFGDAALSYSKLSQACGSRSFQTFTVI